MPLNIPSCICADNFTYSEDQVYNNALKSTLTIKRILNHTPWKEKTLMVCLLTYKKTFLHQGKAIRKTNLNQNSSLMQGKCSLWRNKSEDLENTDKVTTDVNVQKLPSANPVTIACYTTVFYIVYDLVIH